MQTATSWIWVRMRRLVGTLAVTLAIWGVPRGAAADVFANPAWGRITENAEHPGVYQLDVVDVSEAAPLVLPARFPTIIRCDLISSKQPRAVDFEFAQTGEFPTIVPFIPNGVSGKRFRVYTLGKEPQSPDGRIVLQAKDAGKLANGAVAGSSWKYSATRWGKYSVWLTYASSAGEVDVQFAMGDQKVHDTIRPTKSRRCSSSLNLGTVYLAKGGDYTPIVSVDAANASKVEFKTIMLEPACEGTPPVQVEDKPIELHARDATVYGTNLRYEPDPKKNTLGFWSLVSDAASWNVTVGRPGEYVVEVLQGCGKGEGGSKIDVRVNQNRLSFVVKETGHFQNFEPQLIGRVRLPAGQSEVRVQPRKIARHAALDIRQIRLIPAE